MNRVDWERVQEIFHDALEVPTEERDIYLRSQNAGSNCVLDEVRSLLKAYENDLDLLENDAVELGMAAVAGALECSLVGEIVGNYRIISKLGGGGMGDVYLADDIRLDRQVALKFLSAEFIHDQWAKRQLHREAQAVAMLEHRNICQIYQFEESEGHSFIVMPCIRGESLSTLIREKRLPAEQIMPIARQIVDAIATAHENDVIHRDVKPGNVMITESGIVKVLDFGLAKIVHESKKPGPKLDDVTNATKKGLILGTLAYMSPEQLKGEHLDFRTDVFSLGTLLYELATGNHPFEKNNDAETIAAVLAGTPVFDERAMLAIPTVLVPIIKRCVEVDKTKRYPSAVEMLEEMDAGVHSKRVAPSRAYWKLASAAVLIVILILAGYLYFRDTPERGVAILPFANETADAGFDYLADGLAETLSGKLSSVEGFTVVPYSKLAGLPAKPVEPESFGRSVHANLVLTGRLFRENGNLAVETKLIDTSDGQLLRSTSQSLNTDELQMVGDSLLARMFSGLELRPFTVLANSEEGRRETKSNDAFRQYLLGRHYWRKRDPENLLKAIDAFQNAVDLDPGYSRAHAGLADSYTLRSLVAYGSADTKDTIAKARASAKYALEIDPLNAEAYTSLGVILTKHDWNWSEAERLFRRAIEIDPECPTAHYWLSGLLGVTGRAAESIAAAEKAKELDPYSPLVELNLARTFYFARQYDRAIEILNRRLEGETDLKIIYLTGLVHLQKGSYREALRLFDIVSAGNKMLGVAATGYTLARMGRRSDAIALIEQLQEISKNSNVPAQEFAIMYIGLNERDKAFEYLNRSYNERYGSLSAIKVEPLFDPIRDDTRFADLLRKLSLDAL